MAQEERKAFWENLRVSDILEFNFKESPGDNWLTLVDAREDLPLRDALNLMQDFKIRSLPVYKCDGDLEVRDGKPENVEYIAIINVMDIVCWMAWKTDDQDSATVSLGDLIGVSDESKILWKYPSTAKLEELLEPVSKGVHSMLIFAEKSKQRIPYILSQSDIVRFFHENEDKFDKKKLESSLEECGILRDEGHIQTINASKTAKFGYQKMWREQISALAVVDEDGTLVGTLSSSDLRTTTTDEYENELNTLPVIEFLKRHGGSGSDSQICVKTSTSLSETLSLPVKHGVHRLWVVNDENKPTHAVTLSDLIGVIYSDYFM